MNILFYSPYLDTLGGGERYLFTLASYWSKKHTVSIMWSNIGILRSAEKRFGINLRKISIISDEFKKGFISRQMALRRFDVLFYVSDGSIPVSFSRKTILHFQVPFNHVPHVFYKQWFYNIVVCNSQFTMNNLDQTLPGYRCVIYPPVDIGIKYSGGKINRILSVGRFDSPLHAKKQEILITSYIKAVNNRKLHGYSLVLAGGVMDETHEHLRLLRKKAEMADITIKVNLPLHALQALYAESKIYWHAAGFGELDPMKMEHFGISTVEAMAYGCVPVVYNGGGLPEIVKDGENGYLFATETELIDKTDQLIHNAEALSKLSLHAKSTAGLFATNSFNQSYDELLKRI